MPAALSRRVLQVTTSTYSPASNKPVLLSDAPMLFDLHSGLGPIYTST